MKHYTLIIIGAGSAGYPAAMYASRYKINNLVIGRDDGGALATSHWVENWPGTKGASGKDIMNNFRDHAVESGSDFVNDMVTKVEEIEKNKFQISTQRSGDFTCDYLIIATGNVYRKLGVPGEKELLGSGVSYCATCDGTFFKDKDIAMVGGGDSAFTEALYLAEIANTVHLLVRKDKARAEAIWVEKAEKKDNIKIHYNTEVAEIKGKFSVEELLLKDGSTLPVQGIFVAIGSDPDVHLIEPFGLEKDTEGCIVVDKRQATAHPRIYAAGDVTTNSNKFKQTIMSAAEGCLAADSIHEDILHS